MGPVRSATVGQDELLLEWVALSSFVVAARVSTLDGWEYAGGGDGRLYYPVTGDGRSNKLTAAPD